MKKSYRITFALVLVAMVASIVATAQYTVPIYVRGGFNGWGTGNELVLDGGSGDYKADIFLDAGVWELKVASDDWSTVDLGHGGGDPAITLGVGKLLGGGAYGNLTLDITTAEIYRFCLDPSTGLDTPTLLVNALSVGNENESWGKIKALYQ